MVQQLLPGSGGAKNPGFHFIASGLRKLLSKTDDGMIVFPFDAIHVIGTGVELF